MTANEEQHCADSLATMTWRLTPSTKTDTAGALTGRGILVLEAGALYELILESEGPKGLKLVI